MKITILSLFPEYFSGPFHVSMLKRAQERGMIDLELVNIRDYATDKHKCVDDRPYGGGPGMVMLPGPCCEAIKAHKTDKTHVVYMSPQGKTLNAAKCEQLAEEKDLLILCGHYEGVDQRVIDRYVDEEISIGNYVLTNGCVAAIVLVDSVVRFIPGVLGNSEGAAKDSFQADGLLEGPQYTRPQQFEGMQVPQVLLGGNHAEITQWRLEQGNKKTRQVRSE